MPRAFLLVLDSFGCGGALDAAAYGDAGADTLGHIALACAAGHGDRAGLRSGLLKLPHLDALGLGLAAEASTGLLPPGLSRVVHPRAQWGYGVETAHGKDTPSGHWEMAGAPAPLAFGTFPDTYPCFPVALTDALINQGNVPGILGNTHASGTAIIEGLGEAHMRNGWPICYTSVDSVLQVAAHEETFGLERLFAFCRVARKLCDPLNIGRVIARPFVGNSRTTFSRTHNRKDFAVPPPPGNILQKLAEAKRSIVTIGKIGDIFAHSDTGEELKSASNAGHVELTLAAMDRLPDGGLLFANFVDFDTDYGHRRDVPGYAACLEGFDAQIPALLSRLRLGDFLVFTADHGNDPTWKGTDHTREHVPILAYAPDQFGKHLGRRLSFADIGATLAKHLCVRPTATGLAWL